MIKGIVAFRVDATAQLGIGHVKRCLALAQQLRELGSVVFIVRWLSQSLAQELQAQDVRVLRLAESDAEHDAVPTDAVTWLREHWQQDALDAVQLLRDEGSAVDVLVVDSYGLDARWEAELRSVARKIVVIDDLADRRHNCDVLLDQTYNRNALDYAQLVPTHCRLLCGSQYALIRPEIRQLREAAERRRRTRVSPKKLLVSIGGTDPHNITELALKAVRSLPFRRELTVRVVLSSSAPFVDAIRHRIPQEDFALEVATDVVDMGAEILAADVAIGASGTSTWERATLGLPSITVVTADNQNKIATELASSEAIYYAGAIGKLTPADLARAVTVLWTDPARRQCLSENSLRICDGFGVQRTVEEIVAQQNSADATYSPEVVLRAANLGDEERIYVWQGSPGIRRFARNPDVPTLEEHKRWFRSTLSDINRRLYIVEYNGMAAGVVRLDRLIRDRVYEVSILVSHSFQKRGIARQAIQHLQSSDVHELHAHVKPDNQSSMKLFSGAGFIADGSEWFIWKKHGQCEMTGVTAWKK